MGGSSFPVCGGKRVRALYPPLTQFPGGRSPPYPTDVGVRGEDGGLGVLCCIGLHGHPRVREGEMPETSGASQFGSAWKSCSASSEILSGPGLQPHPTVTPSVAVSFGGTLSGRGGYHRQWTPRRGNLTRSHLGDGRLVGGDHIPAGIRGRCVRDFLEQGLR